MSSWNRKQVDRAKVRRRQPDYVRKAGPHPIEEEDEKKQIEEQLADWADDYGLFEEYYN